MQRAEWCWCCEEGMEEEEEVLKPRSASRRHPVTASVTRTICGRSTGQAGRCRWQSRAWGLEGMGIRRSWLPANARQ